MRENNGKEEEREKRNKEDGKRMRKRRRKNRTSNRIKERKCIMTPIFDQSGGQSASARLRD